MHFFVVCFLVLLVVPSESFTSNQCLLSIRPSLGRKSPSFTSSSFTSSSSFALDAASSGGKAGGRITLLPTEKPVLSFSLSFFSSLLLLPTLSLLLPLGQAAHTLLLLALLLLSLPVAILFAPLAALLSLTISSPKFYDRLLSAYNAAVPTSVDTNAARGVDKLLDKIESSGLSMFLGGGGGDVAEFALWILSPFLGTFLNTVRRFASNVQSSAGEGAEVTAADGLGAAVVNTILDAASSALYDFATLVSSVYAAVCSVVVVLFIALGHI
ncbi:hypothetical protein TrST_g11625 [Triparma strigata]|uniref:Transmembrane protein n=1 Tax=Triparma strigata TaxID=1606541 RepID=A0A9W7B7W6_9STRA|nr:hypothetical protein TrST_g11625 [Triparma strigata]